MNAVGALGAARSYKYSWTSHPVLGRRAPNPPAARNTERNREWKNIFCIITALHHHLAGALSGWSGLVLRVRRTGVLCPLHGQPGLMLRKSSLGKSGIVLLTADHAKAITAAHAKTRRFGESWAVC